MVASTLDTPQLLAIAAALGWTSGLRVYAVVFLTGLAGRLGWVDLPSGLLWLQHGPVLAASALLLLVEFCADKLPGIDSLWDLLHTLVRIPAGAALAAAAFDGSTTAWTLTAALMGGTLAATSHIAKSATRAAVNTSPEPFSNVGLSLLGDAMVPTALWLSWTRPLGFALLLVVALGAMVAAIWWLGRTWRQLTALIAGWQRPLLQRT